MSKIITDKLSWVVVDMEWFFVSCCCSSLCKYSNMEEPDELLHRKNPHLWNKNEISKAIGSLTVFSRTRDLKGGSPGNH